MAIFLSTSNTDLGKLFESNFFQSGANSAPSSFAVVDAIFAQRQVQFF